MRIKIMVVLILALFVLAAVFAGCETVEDVGGENGEAYVDSLDRKVVVEEIPERVVSLSPAITEILYFIGAEDNVIGVSSYCDYPPGALEKKQMGGFEDPNLELVVESEPDMVFVAAGVQAEFIKTLEDLGISVFALDAETVEEVIENIKLAGKIMGVEEKATHKAGELRERVDKVTAKVKDEERPVVFFEIWDDPLMSAGAGSFVNDLIELAGGTNLYGDADHRYPTVSFERLVEKDPEIYIAIDHKRQDDIETRTGFDSLQAVKEDRVYTIEDDLVTLPGPRVVDGLEKLAAAIHPHLFD